MEPTHPGDVTKTSYRVGLTGFSPASDVCRDTRSAIFGKVEARLCVVDGYTYLRRVVLAPAIVFI